MSKIYPSISFKNQMKKVTEDSEKLGQLSIASQREAINLLENYDEKKLEDLRRRTDEIDVLTIELERKCIRFIATEQPFASDLMFIEATIRNISHIKRVGHLAMNIADAISKINFDDVPEKIIKELAYMGDYVHLMLVKSIKAFLKQDLEKAKELNSDDDKVDELFDNVLKQATDLMSINNEGIENFIHIIFIARFLERSADRAVNIGNRTIFMLTLKRPDIKPLDEIEE
jgi:phosphate transport system protein